MPALPNCRQDPRDLELAAVHLVEILEYLARGLELVPVFVYKPAQVIEVAVATHPRAFDVGRASAARRAKRRVARQAQPLGVDLGIGGDRGALVGRQSHSSRLTKHGAASVAGTT